MNRAKSNNQLRELKGGEETKSQEQTPEGFCLFLLEQIYYNELAEFLHTNAPKKNVLSSLLWKCGLLTFGKL